MQLRAEILVESAPEPIWALLTDVRRYREWNPFLCEVEGELRTGGMLRWTLAGSDGNQTRERVVVTEVTPGERLRMQNIWLRPGLIDTEYRLELVARSDGTLLVACADVSGWLVKLTSAWRLTAIARGWVGMNEAVKRRIETAD